MKATCRIARAPCSVFISTQCQPTRRIVAWSGWRTAPFAYRVHLGIAHQAHPTAAAPLVGRQPRVPRLADPSRMAAVDVDDIAAAAVDELHHVRRAVPPRQRLVAEDERIGGIDPGRRDEEPLALADVRRVAAATRILRPPPLDQLAHAAGCSATFAVATPLTPRAASGTAAT